MILFFCRKEILETVTWVLMFGFLFLQTDYEGQAKKLLELMENTDLIIIAGGDGTVQEVLQELCPGLLRILGWGWEDWVCLM